MINRYSEFLVERLVSMINESEVVYSDDFKTILSYIKSPISAALSDAESKDIDINNNYFDVSDTKDSISFITDRKAKEILGEDPKFVIYRGGGLVTHNMKENGEIFRLLGYTPETPDGDLQNRPVNGERCEIVSKIVSPESGKTYVRLKFNGGECVINKDKLKSDAALKDVWVKNRQSIRIGRGIRAVLSSLKQEFSDSEIEDFVNKYKSAFDRVRGAFKNFELVSGDDISYWYNSSNYSTSSAWGTNLSNSCMSSVDAGYFDIYTMNPSVCSLLILKDEDNTEKIVGRALVWKLTDPEGVTFMDRVYTHKDYDVDLFREYANSRGWHSKVRMDSSATSRIMAPNGEIVSFSELVTTIRPGEYDEYPYVDTLKHYSTYRGTLSTDVDNGILLEDVSGGFVEDCEECGGSLEVTCPNCDGSRDEDCETCDGDGWKDCSNCDGNGKVDCYHCDGLADVECRTCNGSREETVDCEECDGSGEVDGNPCDNCSGSGTVVGECPDCDGLGRTDCAYCEDGKESCSECEGSGREDCDDCGGGGSQTCSRCEGNGTIDCPVCM